MTFCADSGSKVAESAVAPAAGARARPLRQARAQSGSAAGAGTEARQSPGN